MFWNSHLPMVQSHSRQYMSAIFYYTDAQKKLAEESRDRLQTEKGRPVYTEILPANFHQAEDYHQKYYLNIGPLLASEYRAIYPDINDFVSSTAVARANGYAAGYGTQEQLRKEIDGLGLSAAAREKLQERAEHGLRPACPVSR